MDDARPNPDILLASIQREEARLKRGRLKIFFGMSPGVGKTYAMLREARQVEAQGIDVVAGLVETHGRSETAAMLEGLVSAPRRIVEHRGARLEEMDLDGIIFLRPKLVLVDELAHTNAPGARHPKRYQDVLELLDLGMDVFTTLNVQHVESRAETVTQVTGVVVHETVPDSLLELADEIELIDLSPERLRERLAEGKVYLGDRAAAAAENFFKEDNLSALREIALRLTAERVDHHLRALRTGSSPRRTGGSGERLMVAVGPSPHAISLIRRTRRLAYTLDASWLAVSIDSGRERPAEAQAQLDKNLTLARELGAEVIFTKDEDTVRALMRVAQEQHVTQLVVGKTLARGWRRWFSRGSLDERLLRESSGINIYVATSEIGRHSAGQHISPVSDRVPWRDYTRALAGIGSTTVLGLIVIDWTGYRSIALFYLLAILVLGLLLARGPLLFAAALSALLWDFLFIPPLHTFYIGKFEDGLMLGIFFVVALVTGQLTSRLRTDERNERYREIRASTLYRLARAIAAAGSVDDVLANAVRQLSETFDAGAAFFLADSAFGLPSIAHPASTFQPDEKEHSVAVWAYRNRRKAGRFTDTLPLALAVHFPLATSASVYGVMAILPAPERQLALDERDLLESFAQQIALVLEKESLRGRAAQAAALARSDELHRALFNSVSHELRTPLAVMQAATDELAKEAAPAPRRLAALLGESIERLNRLVRNLLDSARLESGLLEPKREWGEIRDLVEAAMEAVEPSLKDAAVTLEIPPNLPLLHVDFGLVGQALANILHNAVIHGAPPFTIAAEVTGESLSLRISDHGPGIPPDLFAHIFDRFTRASQSKPGGTGLGLAIAKGFIEAEGGSLEVRNAAGGGALFTVRLPLEKPPVSVKLVE